MRTILLMLFSSSLALNAIAMNNYPNNPTSGSVNDINSINSRHKNGHLILSNTYNGYRNNDQNNQQETQPVSNQGDSGYMVDREDQYRNQVGNKNRDSRYNPNYDNRLDDTSVNDRSLRNNSDFNNNQVIQHPDTYTKVAPRNDNNTNATPNILNSDSYKDSESL